MEFHRESTEVSEFTINLQDIEEERALLGHLDRNIRSLRLSFKVDVTSRGGRLTLIGEPDRIEAAAEAVQRALQMIREKGAESSEIAEIFGTDPTASKSSSSGPAYKAGVKPRTVNQGKYMEAIESHPVTLGVGPAGTGKTFLAVAMAVSQVKSGDFRKIVLVRPAVEAGEHLGFLPGDLEAKIAPYLRPLYDSLEDLLTPATMKRFLEEGIIEICPLAYMRGRTLNHAFIILDEAQNTTNVQMKMFLTRMGNESKMVITGDITQVDLPHGQPSGLATAIHVLNRVEGVSIVRMGHADIVRHPVVQRIVKAYGLTEENERRMKNENDGRRNVRQTHHDDKSRRRST
ncbi:MAG: phosphate starvation-inducible PhoH-like protein [Planctomycetota bacterium]